MCAGGVCSEGSFSRGDAPASWVPCSTCWVLSPLEHGGAPRNGTEHCPPFNSIFAPESAPLRRGAEGAECLRSAVEEDPYGSKE
eukprot:1582189-Pyramimonas_sp.AAC.1